MFDRVVDEKLFNQLDLTEQNNPNPINTDNLDTLRVRRMNERYILKNI